MNDKWEIKQAMIDTEDSLIGAILIESARGTNEAITKVSKILKPDHFYSIRDKRIYQAMIIFPGAPHIINTALEMNNQNTLQPKDCAHLSYTISITPCSLDYMDYANAIIAYHNSRNGLSTNTIKGAICQNIQ